MYLIFDNGGIVDFEILKKWNLTNVDQFDSYEEAHKCAEKWLGSASLAIKNKNLLNNPVDYSGFGHTIEIKEIN